MGERSLLKIGEFAHVGQVSVVTLRHYEKEGLLKPLTLDPQTGYRYYALEQLPRLHRILALKDLGFPLDHIARLLEDDLPLEQLQGMLTLKQAQTQQMITAEQERLTRIAARLHQIEQEGKLPTYDMLLKQVDAVRVASYRATVLFHGGFEQSTARILAYLHEKQIEPIGPTIIQLHSRSEQREDGLYIDMETAIPISTHLAGTEQIAIRTLSGGSMVSTIYAGVNLLMGQAYAALYCWIKDNGYQIIGPPRLLRLQHGEHIDASHYVTELQFPVARQAPN
ncbi:MerR family transcriptional regulator [Dictyobacter arantiisoli]|uniref:MerR family transcriptional regulator n=1 Tax=Dictyobacter arantiisoli TaxID=2014874 RepID=A0A5A5THT5_9CHLR|nr:MerR family transcriptional regulator [Dictyobacter arantiisoli]GCF11151.1 MerR family transcriptional regulator [Dictyobacter arantiisoli]